MAAFQLFKMAVVSHLGFLKFESLPIGQIGKANMRLRAKFCVDRSNFCGDMADFRFFFVSFNVLRVWLENAYSRFTPLLGGFGGFDPLDEMQYQPISQRLDRRVKRYITYADIYRSS